jgi:hypothetical protein
LHGGALTARASAEQMRQHRADEHHRGHAQRQARAVVVNRVDDQVATRRDRTPKALVDEADQGARYGQAVHDELVARAKIGRDLQHE